MTEPLPFVLLAKSTVGADGLLLSFEKRWSFRAGQAVGITSSSDIPPRLYSIVSGVGDDTLDILFTVKPDGELTPKLADCPVGATLYLTPPQGSFIGGEGAWWIGAGTGIAPFVSMLRSGLTPRGILHGARTRSRLYFFDELRRVPRYVPCVSREAVPGGEPMRITDYLRKGAAPDTDVPYLVCGGTEMVLAVRDVLIERGVPFEKIVTEIYF